MNSDPCQKLYDEWTRAAEEAQRLKNEWDTGYAFRAMGETVVKRGQRIKYQAAQKRADLLHDKLGNCYKENGMID